MAKGFKTGGREHGTPNKITGELREVLKTALESELNNINDYFNNIEAPEKKLELLSKFLPYIIPKLNTIEMEGNPPPAIKGITFVNVSKQFPDE